MNCRNKVVIRSQEPSGDTVVKGCSDFGIRTRKGFGNREIQKSNLGSKSFQTLATVCIVFEGEGERQRQRREAEAGPERRRRRRKRKEKEKLRKEKRAGDETFHQISAVQMREIQRLSPSSSSSSSPIPPPPPSPSSPPPLSLSLEDGVQSSICSNPRLTIKPRPLRKSGNLSYPLRALLSQNSRLSRPLPVTLASLLPPLLLPPPPPPPPPLSILPLPPPSSPLQPPPLSLSLEDDANSG
ncbi:hypothetical protein Droror1_Dr00026573 [Drosera rotundifolia]